MLGEIAGKLKVYPEQVYYCFKAHRLNPLSEKNKARYIQSLCFARYFDRLENFLVQESSSGTKYGGILLYAAGYNGNINKYKVRYKADKSFTELAFLLFKDSSSSGSKKIEALEKFDSADAFLQQEILAAKAGFYLNDKNIESAEKYLKAAYELNEFAFAPILGRFYAQYRSFGKALEVLEKHLSMYHDAVIALRTAEIYCLLNRVDKIAELRKQYQADSGNAAMIFSYYLDALTAFAKNDMKQLKELTMPLRESIKTPLAAFMLLCVDLQGNDVAAIKKSYQNLLKQRTYLDLQSRADRMVGDFLKRSLAGGSKMDDLVEIATILYNRTPYAFTAKLILLVQ
jgi:tetratricopeptide (TPR) repeat protein